MGSRPWLPLAAALRLKTKNLQANAMTLRIHTVASFMRVVYARRTIVCWVAPLDVRFSPNGTA
jgi:hypothetical protein